MYAVSLNETLEMYLDVPTCMFMKHVYMYVSLSVSLHSYNLGVKVER